MPDRENDILTKALGNKEHPGRTRGIGSKVPWKKGFQQDLNKYKSRRNTEQRRMQEFQEGVKAAFEQMYEEKKRKEREEQEALVTPMVPSSA